MLPLSRHVKKGPIGGLFSPKMASFCGMWVHFVGLRGIRVMQRTNDLKSRQ
jgi:hypothetical protein